MVDSEDSTDGMGTVLGDIEDIEEDIITIMGTRTTIAHTITMIVHVTIIAGQVVAIIGTVVVLKDGDTQLQTIADV